MDKCTDEWSFKNALGDTIMEKLESLYCKIVEVSKCEHPYKASLICSPEVASIFNQSSVFKNLCNKPIVSFNRTWPDNEVFYLSGKLNDFSVYIDSNINQSVLYVCTSEAAFKIDIKDFL